MPSMSKLVPATASEIAAIVSPASATTTTAAPVLVNLRLNIITAVLILGVSLVLALVYTLWKLLPRIRSGELSFSKLEFDWRAELLNQMPKKEKVRRAAEKARREEEMASGCDRDKNEGHVQYAAMQPRVEVGEGDAAAARSQRSGQRHGEADESVAVTMPRE
ncbi:conserved hypothetical protein [Leishmania major strain Friedlin]|uniref:Uncharacterized protein n=1 Tax=Leishmania major TaxID=5664 RepID=Q4Q2I0_LEIMA|nr:conserved hypothetical protein [Leishmania major strain Friedlin]CAG9582241.1 A600 [Leishmania major strain Friedlin]CAJ08085.1 conserved hypothetical protein [Leishmania major strain Friedlin]|eukprot:XP_001686468.1 conserved hypothetical protein [Leishmania major strain Friedlin]